MERVKGIERSAEEIIASFTKVVENLPEMEETYYSDERYNVTRPDKKPSREDKPSDFRERFLAIAPNSDEQGNLRVEVAKWK